MSRRSSTRLMTAPKASSRLQLDRRMVSAMLFGLIPAITLIVFHYF